MPSQIPIKNSWIGLVIVSMTPLISGEPWAGEFTSDFLEFPNSECVAACEKNGYAEGQHITYVRERDVFNCGSAK